VTDNYKRDAMYYEKCLRDMRDSHQETVNNPKYKHLSAYFQEHVRIIEKVLSHKIKAEGVDLDKPNYGMF